MHVMAAVVSLWNVVLLQIIGITQCAPVEPVYDLTLCKGLSPDDCADVIPCVKKYKIKMAELHNETLVEEDIPDEVTIGDLVTTPDQCQALLSNVEQEAQAEIQDETGSTRKKRKALNFRRIPYRKWDLPIYYTIDTKYYSSYRQNLIHDAFKQWEERTCLRFKTVARTSRLPHIEVSSFDGCFSSLGKTANPKQYISLQANGCLYNEGTAIHEIAHALGLVHEQSRPDRSAYIRIFYSKIQSRYHGQFYRSTSTITHGVPYDYASVMHYGPTDFSKVSGDRVLEAIREEFMYTFGQRVEASFMDVLIVNFMYGCLDPNSPNVPAGCIQPTVTCLNGGYPDPGNNCQSCRCPDGLAGDCITAAPGSNACTPLSGTIDVESTQEQCVQSPGYGSRSYRYGEHCSWILRAPVGRSIQLYFDTSQGFGVYHRSNDVCFHWVEIKSNGNLTETGPRFCGSVYGTLNQKETVLSRDNQVVISFRSIHYTGNWNYYLQRGFKLCFHLTGSDPTATIQTTTTPTTTPTTSQTTTSTEATTTTTPKTTSTTPETTSTTTESTTPKTSTPPRTTTTTPETTTTSIESTTPQTTTAPKTTIIAVTMTSPAKDTTTAPKTTSTTPETTSTTQQTATSTMDSTTSSSSTTGTTTTVATTPSNVLYCMNCTAKYNSYCTNPAFKGYSFTQACPKGSAGCFSSVAIKGTGHPYRTTKGCLAVGDSCAIEGYVVNNRYYKKYCCWSDSCNEDSNYRRS